MLKPKGTDNSAMVAKDGNHSATNAEGAQVVESEKPGQLKAQNLDHKDGLWCADCKKPCHNRERCWKLYGKPPSQTRGTKENDQGTMVNSCHDNTAE